VSAHLTLPSNDPVQSEVVDSIPETPPLLPAQAVSAGTNSYNRWLGILGVVVVVAILGSAIYSIVKYLW
jgi:hypothetical protein